MQGATYTFPVFLVPLATEFGLLLAPTSPWWLIYVYIVPFGLTFGARGPIVAALAADLYRGRNYGKVLGLITFGNRIGSAVGPWLGGVIYDLTGSYPYAFSVAIAAIVVAAAALVGAGRLGLSERLEPAVCPRPSGF